MSISSSDIANATANEAQRSAEDLQCLVNWLISRVEALEAVSGTKPADRPELPYERRNRMYLEYMKGAANQKTPQYGASAGILGGNSWKW